MANNADPARKLAVVLHADVVSSTTLVQLNETIAHRRITDAFTRFSETVLHYGGTVREIRGDALVAEFPRASDAVSAALAAQVANREHNVILDGDIRPELRVGIALGEVVIADNTVTGPGIVLAQRLEQLAEAGGVCVQGSIYEAVPNRMPFEYTKLGDQKLKGFEESIRVFSVALKPGESIPRSELAAGAGRRKHPWLAVSLIVLLLITGGLVAWLQPWKSGLDIAGPDANALTLPEKPSIAVLPFENLSGDPEQEYFADGMTDDLITDLSKLSGLFVIARNSSFAYKGEPTDVRKLARELGVQYVLEGSIRRASDQVRINAQLVDGLTGGHLWAERFEGRWGDVFGLQDRVRSRILQSLALELAPDESARMDANKTANPEAYDAFLQGLSLLRLHTRSGIKEAHTHFSRAIELDPDYARAHAALAATYWKSKLRAWFVDFKWQDPVSLVERHLQLAMNHPDPLAHRVAAELHLFRFQFEQAVSEAERAVALDPNDAESYAKLAEILTFAGDSEAAMHAIDQAMRLDPHYPPDYLKLKGRAALTNGDLSKAGELFRRARYRNPSINAWELGAIYGHLGREEEATRVIEEYLRIRGWRNWRQVRHLLPYFPYRRSEDIKRFGLGLVKAGLCCAEHVDEYLANPRTILTR